MKDPLKGFSIATTGDLGRQRTSENIKRWIEANGGRYVTKIDENTTHLVCSTEHWKIQSSMVQAAKRYPKNVKIVTYDWLEDSLMTHSRKQEGEYLIKKHVRADRKKKNAIKTQERKALKKEGTSNKKPTFADSSLALLKKHEEEFKAKKHASKPTIEDYSNYYNPQATSPSTSVEPNQSATSEPKPSSNPTPSLSHPRSKTPDFSKTPSQPPNPLLLVTNEPANHHLYTDLTGYTYNITLVRIDLISNTNERYILRLYQSHTIPYTYALYQRYVKFKAPPEERVLVSIGSSWEQCYKELKSVVKEYTGVEWEERAVSIPAERRDKTKFVFVRARDGEARVRGGGKGIVDGAVVG